MPRILVSILGRLFSSVSELKGTEASLVVEASLLMEFVHVDSLDVWHRPVHFLYKGYTLSYSIGFQADKIHALL